ncbi:MAG: twitch domain-containing radical SAM protein [Bacteriovorax sp.]|nr:twitch domain-containing radical SAM protein [Bacteriovorax sp.]
MEKEDLKKQYSDTKEKLDTVSPSFCLAKWFQVTLHLQNGHNHSCHHPNTHQTNLDELAKNPAALHNTIFKKKIRSLMLEGVRPKECEYCWKIEDTAGSHFSDRHIKSNDDWAKPFFEEAIQAGAEKDINPKYLEVSFSNSCNFKCAYCLPQISSSWMKELKQHGEYQTHSKHHAFSYLEKTGKMPIADTSLNPYVKSFWEWWPTLYKDLKTFRITGGEPFMVPDTYKVLEYVAENPNPQLSLAINTNLGVEQHLIDKAVVSIKKILDAKHVKDITIFTSLDTWGIQAEYIRYGLNMDLFLRNLTYVLEKLPEVKLTFMCTYNLLSISSFRAFLEFILNLKNKYKVANTEYDSRIVLDISYLKDPQFMCANLADKSLLDQMKSDLLFLSENSPNRKSDNKIGFTDFELNKMQRLFSWASVAINPVFKNLQLKDNYIFFSEYDRRRGTNFLQTYPEYTDLWNAGKHLAQSNGV